MKRLGVLISLFALCSCASKFDKKKKLESEKMLGETVFRQDGKLINKFQVFDEIGQNSKDKKALIELKKDFVLATSAAGVGGALLTFGVLEKNGSNKILIGGALIGLGYYYAIRADEQLAPYVEKHNKRRTSFLPQFLITPDGESVTMGLGYNLFF